MAKKIRATRGAVIRIRAVGLPGPQGPPGADGEGGGTGGSDPDAVKLTGNQTIAGTKTFSASPVVPDASFGIAKTNGLQVALDAKVPTTRTVAGKALSSDVTLAKADVGLGSVDNTSDAAKPVSTAQQDALNLKADASVLAGNLPVLNAVKGAGLYIRWNGTGWTYGGTVITARPTSSTDVVFIFADTIGSSTWPSWALVDVDLGLKIVL